jgi:hypothetical protein
MTQKRLTPIDYLIKKLVVFNLLNPKIKNNNSFADMLNKQLEIIINETKAIEKLEIEDAFQNGKWDWSNHLKLNLPSTDSTEYYNENFEK